VEVFMPWLSVYGSVRQAIQDLVAPEIQKLHGEIGKLEGKMDGFEAKLEAFRGEVNAKFEAVDHRFESIDHRFESIDHRFESIDHRFESLDGRLTAFEESFNYRLAAVEETVKSSSRKIDHFIEERVERYIKSIDQKWHEAIDIHERLAALEAKLETR